MGESKLFQPVTVGNMKLEQRLAMCPLTRFRATERHVPMPSFEQYYGQRASTSANVPGIYNEEQIEAWRKVTDAVHDKGSFIVCQLWALGRTASVEMSEKEEIVFRSSGNIAVDADRPAPAPLILEEIKTTAQQYAKAAKNAMRAGFDAVELHGANGYLIDQFLQDTANNRTDSYGGSVDNRSRFALEMVQAVCDAVGPERTGIRFSPWSTFNAMKMEDPIPQFTDIIKKLNPLNLAYIHLVESRIAGNLDVEAVDSLAFAVEAREGPLLIAGGHTPETARRLVDEDFPDKDIVVGFGRFFISTPDLPFRIKTGLELSKYNRDTFYTPMSTVGYTDYPFSKEFIDQSQGSLA